ncbi:hypothetical protein ACHAXS_013399 [Conticribra weissflogii]
MDDTSKLVSSLETSLELRIKMVPFTVVTSFTVITAIYLITFADAVAGFNPVYYSSPSRLSTRTKNHERVSIFTLRDLHKPYHKNRGRNVFNDHLSASPSPESDEGVGKSQDFSVQVSASRRSDATTNEPVDAESKRQSTKEKDRTSDENKKKSSETTVAEVKATKLKETVVFKQDKNNHKQSVNQENTIPTPQSSNSQHATFIQDLLTDEDFEQSCRRHITLTLLRKYFPTLLELPALTQSTAKCIYDQNVTVTTPSRGSSDSSGGSGSQEILAMGMDEVLGVTRALAVASTAARRAGSLLDLAVGGGGKAVSSTGDDGVDDEVGAYSPGHVECELLIDPENPLKVLVLWRTRLPAVEVLSLASPLGGLNRNSQSSPPSFTEFSGSSVVNLSPETGLVTNLQIQKVKINGITIVESIGTALAAVRRAAKTAMTSSTIFDNILPEGNRRKSNSGNPFLDGILNGIQRELAAVADAVDAVDSRDDSNAGSPLYVLPESRWKGATFPVEETMLKNETVKFSTSERPKDPVLIQNYISEIPLPGSDEFVGYATIHQAMSNFAKFGLPRLAGNSEGSEGQGNDNEGSIRTLFTTDACLVTSNVADRSNDPNNAVSLLRGAGKIADLYRSIALLREASGVDWIVTGLNGKWQDQTLEVSWKSESPLQIEGTDAFLFEVVSMPPTDRLPVISDGDKDNIASRCSDFLTSIERIIPLKITRIENRKLTVAGATADSEWAKSFVSAALRSGWMDAPLSDPTIAELFRKLTKKRTTSSKESVPKKEPLNSPSTMPNLDDAAAASFYGILRALYRDLPRIGNSESHLSTPPAAEYLADSIELHGLLNEVLARGNKPYNRLVGLALSSLRVAIQTNRVRLAATPRPIIQITPRGTIKVDFILALWIDAPSFPLVGPRSRGDINSNNNVVNGGFGVPLKIEVDSEYIIDSTGKISEHRINESRLNGILTPGDVFSSWIKRLAGESEDEERYSGRSRGAPSALDSLVDAITWVRSMQDRK